MTKSVMITASNNQFCRKAESVGCRFSVPSQQAKELKEFAGRTISNSGDSIHTHKPAQPVYNLNTPSG